MTNDSDLDDGLLWPMLYHSTLRRAPRLLEAWGRCAVCHLPATHAGHFCGIVWVCCATCRVRWPILDSLGGILELDAQSDEATRAYLALLVECSDIEPLPVGISPPEIQEQTMRPKAATSTSTESFGFDPHRHCGDRGLRMWGDLASATRVAVTDPILRDMIEHPPFVLHPVTKKRILATGAPMHCWHRIRAVEIAGTNGLNFEQVTRRDPSVSPEAIANVMRLVLSLSDRRAELEEQLFQLRSLGPALDVLPQEQERETA